MTAEVTSPGGGVPQVSVVVAVQGDCGACIAALLRDEQAHPGRMEILACGRTAGGEVQQGAKFPSLTWIDAGHKRLTPELWECGIRMARAPVVALTTSSFEPAPGWIDRMLDAQRGDRVGAVGGVIDQRAVLNPVAWAVFFCRYSAFMPPLEGCDVAEVAADNASYKKAVIDQYARVRLRGFWETEVHHEMRRDGYRLVLAPDAVVWHARSSGIGGFLGQRFRHGRHFAQDRGLRMNPMERVLRAALFPLTPLVMGRRIARNVAARKRHRLAFVLTSPLVLLFLTAWAAGECAGYLAPGRSPR